MLGPKYEKRLSQFQSIKMKFDRANLSQRIEVVKWQRLYSLSVHYMPCRTTLMSNL